MIDLANPESLLGMLQRGRGKGLLAALDAAPETVWPLLFECITHDPRIDTQCETRAEYYAGLIAATGMDLRALQHHLKEDDAHDTNSDLWPSLTFETLTCMAKRGGLEALQTLCDYVSYGQMWHEALFILGEVEAPEAHAQAAAALCGRVGNDADVDARFEHEVLQWWRVYCNRDEDERGNCRFLLPICEPWKSICERNAEFADLFRRVSIDYDRPPPSAKPSKEYLVGLSLKDMFSLVDASNQIAFLQVLPDKVTASDEDYLVEQLATVCCTTTRLALRGLAKLGTPRAFEAARSLIEDRADVPQWARAYAGRAMAKMPGRLTLETARQWFQRPEFHLHLAGGEILAHQATREDVPLLIEALHMPEMHQGDDCRFSDALEALARFDGLGFVPELEQIFCHTDYSYSRARAAKAMAATAPAEFVSRYARECLWDCHWDTREVGCRMADISAPSVVERLRELATGKNESDGTRQAAEKRLKESMP